MIPWYPKAILAVTAALVLALATVPGLRRWAFRVEMRRLIAFHLVRFVGIYFLYLYSQGELPYNFAVVGGIGDIIVATLAIVIVFWAPSKPVLLAWNLLGLADIVGVAVTAARSEMAVPGSMHQLDKFPLILLPTLIVPLIVVTHGLMLVRMAHD
jgi:hypothetical protein